MNMPIQLFITAFSKPTALTGVCHTGKAPVQVTKHCTAEKMKGLHLVHRLPEIKFRMRNTSTLQNMIKLPSTAKEYHVAV